MRDRFRAFYAALLMSSFVQGVAAKSYPSNVSITARSHDSFQGGVGARHRGDDSRSPQSCPRR